MKKKSLKKHRPLLKKQQYMSETPAFAVDPTQYSLGGDIGAGLTGVIGGIAGSVPILGSQLQKGVYNLDESIQGPLNDQQKSIRGYGQATGAIGTAIATGGSTTMNAIGQSTSGIGQGIEYGNANNEDTRNIAMGLDTAGKVGQIAGKFMKNGGLYPNGGKTDSTGYLPLYYQRGVKDKEGNMKTSYYKTLTQWKSGNTINPYATTNLGSKQIVIDPQEFYHAAANVPNQIGYGPISGDLNTTKDMRFIPEKKYGRLTNNSLELDQELIDNNKLSFENGGKIYNNWSTDPYINLAAPTIYQSGGLINKDDINANAQLEKNEVMKYPNGETDQVNAPPHSGGGINLNLPPNTQIFSDHLKDPDTKQTFAKVAEQFKNNRWDKIIDDKKADPLRIKTAEMMKAKNDQKLDQIFQKQEQMKKDKAINAFNRFQKKYGGYATPMFWSGGMSKGSVNDYLPRYEEGGDSYYDKPLEGKMDDSDFGTKPISTQGDNSTNLNPLLTSGIGTVANSFAPAMYLGKYGNKYDKVNYGSVTPKYLDPTAQLNDIDRSSYGTQKQIPEASGGNSGIALNSLLQNTTNRDVMKSRIRSDYDNQNVGIANQSIYANQDYKMRGIVDEAANKGRMISNDNAAIGAIGSSVAQGVKDYSDYNRDAKLIGSLKSMYPDFNFNDKNWQYSFKQKYGVEPSQAIYKGGKPTNSYQLNQIGQ